jgi:F-box interacting protein
MDGSVVNVIKVVSGSTLLSTSMDDLICVSKYCYFTQVIDPATGKVLLDWQKQDLPDISGYGRAVPSGAYKVVSLGRVCKVHTLGDVAGWRLAELPPTLVWRYGSSSVVVNGVMYVLYSPDLCNSKLLRFDLETEEWKEAIEGPKMVAGPEVWNGMITELNGTLCMVQWEILTTNIWLLNDSHKDNWIKMYTIPIVYYTYPMPLKMTSDGDGLIFCCDSAGGEGQVIQVYYPNSNALTVLPRLGGTDAIKIGLCSLHLDRFISAKT